MVKSGEISSLCKLAAVRAGTLSCYVNLHFIFIFFQTPSLLLEVATKEERGWGIVPFFQHPSAAPFLLALSLVLLVMPGCQAEGAWGLLYVQGACFAAPTCS